MMPATTPDADFVARWRRDWFRSIAEFSDLSLQRRSWLGGPEFDSPYWSFVEFMCRYFDDYRLTDGYDSIIQEGLVSVSEASAVAQFHAAASSYSAPRSNDYDHHAILADPKWLHVVQLADNARCSLLDIVTDPRERAILLRQEVLGA